MAHIRRFGWFVATEISLAVITALIFTGPSIISAMSSLGLFMAAWYGLTWPSAEHFYPMWIRRLPPIRRHVVIIGLSGLVGMSFWVFGSPMLEDRLYASGNFGEPPRNRYLAYRQYQTNEGYVLILEFGARKSQIIEPYFQARVGANFDKQRILAWGAESGRMPDLIDDIQVYPLMPISPSNPNPTEYTYYPGSFPDLLAVVLWRATVQPNHAWYFALVSNESFEISNCLFKPWGVDDKECPDEVELIDATSSDYN